MDFQKYSKLILIVVIIIGVVGVGVFNIIQERNNQKEIDTETIKGTLIINNPGLSEGWYISYEKSGNPGLIKKIVKTSETSCSGTKEKCAKFFEKKENLAGAKVKVVGIVNGDKISLKQINFYNSPKTSCNFDFNNFKVKNILNKEEYIVDFETNSDAKRFKTRITEQVEKGPNFAGKYRYVRWGCGTNCGSGAIINLETGDIVEYGLVDELGVDFKVDSKLLVINPQENKSATGALSSVETKYFLMSEDDLLLLCEK